MYGYDNEGQLSSKQEGNTTSYSFDKPYRLTGMGANTQFSYDGAGNRLRAVRSGTETRYIYDASGNLLAEADASNTITRYYVHGAGLLAAITPADAVYCYHFDATGNTVAITDGSENVVNSYDYSPFGMILSETEAFAQPFKYVGKLGVMAEGDFYYMRARYYDPLVGRFISEDPMGFDGGDVNLYVYAGNNPVLLVDPWGLWTLQIGFSGTAGAGGGVTSGGGIVLGFSWENGFQIGTYDVIGGGGYGSASFSGVGEISFSTNTDINDLSGGAVTSGGSAGEGISLGGEANIPMDTNAKPSWTLSVGGGGGIPFETHAFLTNTHIHEITNQK